MSSKYIDFHNHSQNPYDEQVLALPTYRIGVDSIPPYIPNIWLGIHPYDVDLDVSFESEVAKQGSRVVGIGEIGLDYYYNSDNTERQDCVFIKQLDYAIDNLLPVTIHCVRGYNRLYEIFSERRERLTKTVLHGFINSMQMADSFFELGCYISFSPSSFASRKTVEVMQKAPLDKVFLETDDNQMDIKLVYKLFSQYRDESVEEIEEVMFNNFKKVIGKCQIG